jgi:hypothetical protein
VAGVGIAVLLWVLGELRVHPPRIVLYALLILSGVLIVAPLVVIWLQHHRGDAPLVSEDHRKDLQAIAEHLREGVRHTHTADYLAPGNERVNHAIAFSEHFPEIAGDVARWNGLVEAREAARRALGDWVAARLLSAGITGVGRGVVDLIVHEAEAPEPHFSVEKATSEVRIGGRNTFAFSLAPAPNRAEMIVALQDLFDEIASQPELARVVAAKEEMESVQIPLIDGLELVRDKTAIGGRCKLCE